MARDKRNHDAARFGIMSAARAERYENDDTDWCPREIENAEEEGWMVVRLRATHVFPVGTPDDITIDGISIRVYRDEVSHWHTPDGMCFVEDGRDSDGYAIARCPTVGTGIMALMEFCRRYPAIDRQSQAMRLRRMVRPGD